MTAIDKFFSGKRIMVVAAHPDDELLGLGATMNRLIRESRVRAHAVILGEGITSRSDARDAVKWKKELALHRRNVEGARKAIGYRSVSTYDFPDNRFDAVALLDIVKVIEKEKKAFKPDMVFTHHGGDVNIDHQRAYEAVIAACRPLREEGVKAVVSFETPSSTEWRPSGDHKQFAPNLFVSVSEANMRSKIKGMESYVQEKRPFPHPRSPEALKIQARRWGVATGVPYAEAFHIHRLILD